ncbi:MAG TPA: RimK family alpha-L-glutamate ligase [Coriobacteriia bacterium]|nr:RimK family alpha-L-glutamate ligase [Coriobacteriia bacterium]
MSNSPTVAFICGSPNPPSRARFEAECEVLGATALWLDPRSLHVFAEGPRYEGAAFPLPDVVIPRSGGLTSDDELELLRALELLGAHVVDSPDAVALCRDKLAIRAALHSSGVMTPTTIPLEALTSENEAETVAAGLGGFPVVVKPSRGMRGEGVKLVQSAVELVRVPAAPTPLGKLLAQRYLPSQFDLRVIVVGGEPLGAVRRHAGPGDFRANLELGGRAECVPLPDDVAALAVAASRSVGADVAAVDMLPDVQGWQVIEVNSAPGFAGFEEVTGVNVAAAIVSAALEGVRR